MVGAWSSKAMDPREGGPKEEKEALGARETTF
jgi:hypothetical protein